MGYKKSAYRLSTILVQIESLPSRKNTYNLGYEYSPKSPFFISGARLLWFKNTGFPEKKKKPGSTEPGRNLQYLTKSNTEISVISYDIALILI